MRGSNAFPSAPPLPQAMNSKYGMGKVVDVLRGSNAKTLQDYLKEIKDSQGVCMSRCGQSRCGQGVGNHDVMC